MAGTQSGGLKAARTNRKKYGRDYYQVLGSVGGRKSRTGGFHHMAENDAERHKEYSRQGGAISRRGKAKDA